MKPVVLTFSGHRLVAPASGYFIFRHGTTSIAGTTYKTAQIGSQEWLAENLQLDDGGSGIYTGQSAPYASEHFYTWDAAIRVAATVGDGWHLPTQAEFTTLVTTAGGRSVAGKALKSLSGWKSNGNGVDKYGFSALPVGDRNEQGVIGNNGFDAYFWGATEMSYYNTYAYRIWLYYDEDWADDGFGLKNCGFSIRLVRSA